MAKQSMMIHLEQRQKEALQAKAIEQGTSVSALIRRAVDKDMEGLNGVELEELDLLTREAEKAFAEMAEQLEAANRRVGERLSEIARIRRDRAT